jgi:hypothetical protein
MENSQQIHRTTNSPK